MPFWMLLIGKLFFGARVGYKRVIGAILSIAGVLLVLSRGELQVLLSMHWVPGDLYMIAATIAWAFYSWMLIRSNWSAFLMAQIGFGVVWSSLFAAGE